MIVLSAKDIKKEYGADTILEGITFGINERDRVGIVGANGAGKTTLLNIISGEESATSGDVYVSKDTKIGYLRQRDEFISDRTVLEEMEDLFKDLADMEEEMLRVSHLASELSGEDQKEALERYEELMHEFEMRGGYRYKSDIKGILSGMAFGEEYYDKKISMLSGGERTRLALCALLLQKPNILLLDEPTNHLDIGTLKWLEQYLSSYKGTIVIVSHDRYFLNETVTRIFDVTRGRLDIYEGNYDFYAQRKREIREEEMRAYQKQQKEIKRQEELIRRYKGRGTEKLAKRAASREKRLEHMNRLERPEAEIGKVKIHFKEKFKSGTDVLFGKNISKSFGYGSKKRELFSGVGFDIKRGEKICIVGANGIGKTTLIRMIKGELEPDEGTIKYGHNVEIAYYDQGQRLLNEQNTVFDEMKDDYRLYTDTQMRSLLGRFLFRGDDVFLPISALSGGEKARLSLLKLMLSGANLLLLDEPTNHLDIDSKEVFEDALMDFPGTAIIISHDRYLLSKVPTRILELEKDGLTEYLGKYDYYIDKKEEIKSGSSYLDEMGRAASSRAGSEAGKEAPAPKLSAAEERRLKKEAEAKARREKRELEELENKIEELELRIHEIEEEMCTEEVLSDYLRLDALGKELEDNKEQLSKYYQKWLQ